MPDGEKINKTTIEFQSFIQTDEGRVIPDFMHVYDFLEKDSIVQYIIKMKKKL